MFLMMHDCLGYICHRIWIEFCFLNYMDVDIIVHILGLLWFLGYGSPKECGETAHEAQEAPIYSRR